MGFYIGNRQVTFDAEVLATMTAIHLLTSRLQTGQAFTIVTDSQAAMKRVETDSPGSGRDMAIEIIDLASKLYEQENTLTVRWVPGHCGIIGNQIADAEKAARKFKR